MTQTDIRIVVLLVSVIGLRLILRPYTAGSKKSKRKLLGSAELAPTLGVGCLTVLAGFCFTVSTVVWIITPGWMAWSQVAWPRTWLTMVPGAGLLLSTLVLYVAARVSLGRNFVGGIGLTEGHSLVTSGPYRYIRNPIYAACGIGVLGVGFYTLNVVPFATFGLVTWCLTRRVPYEEQLLERQFGDQWRRYAARTGRYWPNLRHQP